MIAPLAGPTGFPFVAALGAACKTICGMVAGATRASITAHFALSGNLADVRGESARGDCRRRGRPTASERAPSSTALSIRRSEYAPHRERCHAGERQGECAGDGSDALRPSRRYNCASAERPLEQLGLTLSLSPSSRALPLLSPSPPDCGTARLVLPPAAAAGGALAHQLGDSPLTGWLAFLLLTSLHVWANVYGVGCLAFSFLNPQVRSRRALPPLHARLSPLIWPSSALERSEHTLSRAAGWRRSARLAPIAHLASRASRARWTSRRMRCSRRE